MGTWQERSALKLQRTLASADVQVQLGRASDWLGGSALVGDLAAPDDSGAAGEGGRLLPPYD